MAAVPERGLNYLIKGLNYIIIQPFIKRRTALVPPLYPLFPVFTAPLISLYAAFNHYGCTLENTFADRGLLKIINQNNRFVCLIPDRLRNLNELI